MKLVNMICPNCSAHLKIDAENREAKCEYCGATIYIDDEVHQLQFINAEEAGYNFEKGRQRAQAEALENHTNDNRYTSIEYKVPKESFNNPPKRRTWLWVLGWIFCLPAPVMILIWRKKSTLDKKLKILLTIIFWILYIILSISVITQENDVSDKNNETNIIQEEASTKKKPLDDFFREYVAEKDINKIESLTKKLNLKYKTKRTSSGDTLYRIALTKKDAKFSVSTTSSRTPDVDYYIFIDCAGKSVSYYNNVDYTEIYSFSSGEIVLHDCTRLEPFENGTDSLNNCSVEEALDYKPDLSLRNSPIEQFYEKTSVGITGDELQSLMDEYSLSKHYRRSNSDDGYISYSGYDTTDTGNCIKFVYNDRSDTLEDLDFYDYYVLNKYGLHINYVSKNDVAQKYNEYTEEGYYIVGDNTSIRFNSATEALKALHDYREK